MLLKRREELVADLQTCQNNIRAWTESLFKVSGAINNTDEILKMMETKDDTKCRDAGIQER